MLGLGSKRNATITATSHVRLLRLDHLTCLSILGSVSDIFAREASRRARIAHWRSSGLPIGYNDLMSATDHDFMPAAEGDANASTAPTVDQIVADAVTHDHLSADAVGHLPQLACGERLRIIVASRWFVNVANALVGVNVLLMCLLYDGMPPRDEARIEWTIDSITLLFVAEMGLKQAALGCAGYWADKSNRWDGLIVVVSVIELVANVLAPLTFLRVLRLQRVLRMVRLLRSFSGLHEVLTCFGRTLSLMVPLAILLLLYMLVAALIGMQTIGGAFSESAGYSVAPCLGEVCADPRLLPKPRLHFDYFGPALCTVFTLLTGQWADAMLAGAAALGPSCALYYATCVLFGRYVLVNLLIAVVMHAFYTGDDQHFAQHGSVPIEVAASPSLSPAPSALWVEDATSSKGDGPQCCGRLCGICHRWRSLCKWLVQHRSFAHAAYLLAVSSCVALVVDSPRLETEPDAPLPTALRWLEVYLWPLGFTIEFLLRAAAGDVCSRDGAQLRIWWRRLMALANLTVVITCWLVFLSHIAPPSLSEPLRRARALRVLRLLLLVEHSEGMALIVSWLSSALPKVYRVFIVVVALQAIFAVLGMELFMGSLASCSDLGLTTKEACLAAGHTWASPIACCFDDFASAMLTLYVMSTGDEWEVVMFRTMDATERGRAPLRHDTSPVALFSISWMFIGSFFAMNLIVGVIVDQFNRSRAANYQSASLTPHQLQWVETMKAAQEAREDKIITRPRHQPRRALFDIVQAPLTDWCVMALIFASIIVMSCYYWRIEEDVTYFALYNECLAVIRYAFYFEAALKITAYGPRAYFGDAWCQFDFFLVVASAAHVLVQFINSRGEAPMLLRVLRLVRILRTFRLLKHAHAVRNLLFTLMLSLPMLANVGGLLLIVLTAFAVLGVDLFPFVAHQEYITAQRNFESFPNALLLLFQCLTGDGWSGLMTDAMVNEATGACTHEAGNCGSWLALPFFIFYQLVGSFVFLNVVVAVILEHFSSIGHSSKGRVPGLVTPYDVGRFQEIWATFDPYHEDFIAIDQLPDLLLALPPPLGLRNVAGKKQALQLCIRLAVPDEKDTRGVSITRFNEVLDSLVAHNFKLHGLTDSTGVLVRHHGTPVSTIPDAGGLGTEVGTKVGSPSSWDGLRRMHAIRKARNARERLASSAVAQRFALQLIAENIRQMKHEILVERLARSECRRKRSTNSHAHAMVPSRRNSAPVGMIAAAANATTDAHCIKCASQRPQSASVASALAPLPPRVPGTPRKVLLPGTPRKGTAAAITLATAPAPSAPTATLPSVNQSVSQPHAPTATLARTAAPCILTRVASRSHDKYASPPCILTRAASRSHDKYAPPPCILTRVASRSHEKGNHGIGHNASTPANSTPDRPKKASWKSRNGESRQTQTGGTPPSETSSSAVPQAVAHVDAPPLTAFSLNGASTCSSPLTAFSLNHTAPPPLTRTSCHAQPGFSPRRYAPATALLTAAGAHGQRASHGTQISTKGDVPKFAITRVANPSRASIPNSSCMQSICMQSISAGPIQAASLALMPDPSPPYQSLSPAVPELAVPERLSQHVATTARFTSPRREFGNTPRSTYDRHLNFQGRTSLI